VTIGATGSSIRPRQADDPVEPVPAADVLPLRPADPERIRGVPPSSHRGWLVRRTLLVADVAGLVAAFLLAETVGAITSESSATRPAEIVAFVVAVPLWVVAAKLNGLYDDDEETTDRFAPGDFGRITGMVTMCVWLIWAFAYLTQAAHPSPTKLIVFWAAAIASLSLARSAARTLSRRRPAYHQNAIVLGTGPVGQLVVRKILNHPEYGISVVGFLDSAPQPRDPDLQDVPVLGGLERLLEVFETFAVERVIVAFPEQSDRDVVEVIRTLSALDVRIDIVPRFFEMVGPGVAVHTVEGLPLLGLRPFRWSRSSLALKRATDVALSAAALFLLAPLFLVIAVGIKLDSSGPVFFRQERMGRKRPFRIWKFRTMDSNADARKGEFATLNRHASAGGDSRMFKIVDDPRVTRVGSVLRRHSLDELPQLINVLRSDMSLVGPRPLILDEDLFVTEWARRRELKPGCTGLWQVLGHSAIPFEEMLRLDYLYVTNWSLANDLKLIGRTVPVLLRGKNI
jgi:exopolysaccharide biosynthesis polyprenyl glycosylphosphotransferase